MSRSHSDKHQYWQAIIEEFKVSGLTQKRFCEDRQLNFRQFKYYRYRVAQPSHSKPDIAEFAPIHLTPSAQQNDQSSSFKVLLPTGLSCIIPADFNKAALNRLLEGKPSRIPPIFR